MRVPKKIPDFKKGSLDPHTETELQLNFQRLYEYIDSLAKKVSEELEKKIVSGDIASQDLNALIGAFSQPLAGSDVVDPLLQSILKSFGPQVATHFFGGPIPSFRSITLADLPAGAVGYNRIQEEGANLAQELILDFVGAGVTASAGAGKTIVTIPGSGGSSSAFNIFNAWNL